ncbi:MAG: hypothetical protein ACO3E1_10865 [Flavobacteriales bacterium]
MQNKKTLLTSALIVALGFTASAQLPAKFSMNGLGRSYILNNKLSGNIMNGDNQTHSEGLGGYNLFDLKNNLAIDSMFQASAEFRVRSEFGAFFGSNTTFKFRQFKMMGTVGDFKYEVGDIRLQMTPFTVFNFCDMYNKYEGEIFKNRRAITEYENMNSGNGWLLQGAHIQHRYNGEGWGLGTYGFVTRTSSTNDADVSDRLLAGARVAATLGESLIIGGNYVGLNDVDIQSSQFSYKNHVGTGDVDYTKVSDGGTLNIHFEGGASSYKYSDVLNDSSQSFKDFFFALKGSYALSSGLKFGLGYTNVGPNYNSPTAQSRRVADNQNPALFGMVSNASVARTPILFDRLTSEQVYNARISGVLTPFLNEYNNAQPYGKATPNRSGASLLVASDTSMKNICFEIGADYLTEIAGEGTPEKRTFMVVKGGVKLELGKMMDWSRKFDVSVGGRMEKTSRSGNASVALSSIVADAGASFELVKKIDLLLGYKMLTADGNEFKAPRNDFNQITNISEVTINSSESIASAGLQLRFSPMQAFSVNYNMITYNNALVDANSYKMSQLSLVYQGKF